ncbi:MAG: SDR family NAD(P)-dependent oxidoreductase [Deltaproteobacteria bacterium]|nr:SDR family NAD(P)-dependent oxidoreductase [Deltaproteobacteria bacterium]
MLVQGARVLVAGGSSGVGLGTAKACARQGCKHVVLVARGSERLDKARAQVAALGVRCDVLATDLTQAGAIEALEEFTDKIMGGVDLLVCNVANGEFRDFNATSDDDLQAAWTCTALVAYRLAKTFVPPMRERGRGHVAIVNSPVRATPYFAVGYKVSRTALFGVAEALRSNLEGSGVGLTYAEPPRISDSGYFDTNAGVLDQLPPMFRSPRFAFLWQTSDEAGRMVARAIANNRYWATTFLVGLLVLLAPFLPMPLLRFMLGDPVRKIATPASAGGSS